MGDLTQYLSQSEWYAAGGGLAMGWLATEAVKRFWRSLHPNAVLEKWWFLPILGFVITAVSTWSIWPKTGLFPHPVFIALLTGLAAPITYKVVIALLRKTGQDWLADILAGKKT
jgi:hypothetical protein